MWGAAGGPGIRVPPGWFKRVALENLLGLTLRGGVLHVAPQLPGGWSGYEAVWKNGGGTYRIINTEGGRVTVTPENAAPDGAVVEVQPIMP